MISLSSSDRYALTERAWTAVHSAYSEMAPDASYVHADDEWTGTHTSYEDVYVPSEPEPSLPDRRAMWAAVHPPAPSARSMDDSVVTASVSSDGTVSLALDRDSAPFEQALPMSTTAVQVSVPGTDLSTWEVCGPGSPTLDVSLTGLPPGLHTVEVKAFSNGRVVGVTQITVRVEAKAAEPVPEPSETPAPAAAAEADAPEEAPRAPERLVLLEPSLEPEPTPVREPGEPVPERPWEPEVAWTAAPPRREASSAPSEESSGPASQVYVGGQAMAAGLGISWRTAGVGPDADAAAPDSVAAVETVLGEALDGHGSGRRPGSGQS